MRRAFLLAAILSLVAAAPVAAAAVNDTPATAIEVFLPATTVTEDTTLADETDAFETALNANCGAPAVEHGVWFELTPDEDVTVSLDVTDSDYAAGIFLFQGDPTVDSMIVCAPGEVVESLTGGTRYTFMVFGDGTGGPTAGEMILRVTEAVPPPDLAVTVNSSATIDRSGVVRLSGTITCSSESEDPVGVEIFGDLTQRVGRLLIRGFFGTFIEVPCQGETTTWEAFAVGDNGVFAGGKGATAVFAFGCTDACSEASVTTTIQLKRNGK